MANKIIWGIFFTITALLFSYILFFVKLEPAGDIAEYFGITESILNHGSIELTQQDEQILSRTLHPAYFQDPQYYIKGKDGNRYPVHFPLYSFLAVPVRVILIFFQLDELKTLAITNLAILTITSFWIVKKFLTSPFQRIVFLAVVYLSPILSFITWPGPDLFYVCMLLLSIYFFFNSSTIGGAPSGHPRGVLSLPSNKGRSLIIAVIFAILASWHSQPLIIIALAALVNYFLSETLKKIDNESYLQISWKVLITCTVLFLFILIPYFYNLAVFGLLTPWTIIENGWTRLNGFGLQNANLKKLFEQFFDLNIGLFWYVPLIFLSGCFFFIKSLKKNTKEWILLLVMLATAIFYQTNPAWHYGTAGFGPTRHIIFILPFLIYFIVRYLKITFISTAILILIISSQIFTLSLNGFVTPKFENTLYHSPYASFVLNNFPQFYNPTPEIFIDRSNHTDLDYVTTAIYKSNDGCKKAYVVKTEIEYLKKQCGYIPSGYEKEMANEFLLKASYPRTVWTKELTFWPDPESCAEYFIPTKEKPYICMKTLDNVVKYTGVSDRERFTTLPDYLFTGIWKLEWGEPIKITVPAGYIINHYSLEGMYVNY